MNPLVVDKIAKQFIYDKDSGFIFTRNLIADLPADWRYTVLVPPKVPREFFPANRIVDLKLYNYSTSIHQNRYHFNREILVDISPYSTDYDAILCNQPEIAANLRVFFLNQRREKPVIINFFHWIDCEESRKYGQDLGGYIWREIDGVLSADMNYFHTPYAKRIFDKELNRLGVLKSNFNNNGIEYKADYFNVKPTIFGRKPIDLPNKKIILFNHRMNETTGWQDVMKACSILRTERNDFVLWFTDDQKTDLNETLSNIDFVKVQRVPFESYGYLMNNAFFSVCNLQGYATWNLAVLDSIANNCCPIVRISDLMDTLIPRLYNIEWAQQCTFGNVDELVNRMRAMLDKPYYAINNLLPKDTCAMTENTVERTIMNAINVRLESKIPKKYNDVKAFIQHRETFPDKTTKFGADLKMNNANIVPKKDWVNYFWSFHANGNFQKIRLRLLAEGIKDDITKSETTYYN
jgi:glycosyltransferase involved in cell wall biosynthesis